jgi:glycosyltransferase involved in cell wall biosynthesis
MQFHILSFEGPDPYSRAGGLATRVDGLAQTLAGLGFETHLWFVGDPDLPGQETRGLLHFHRWAQWVSRYHPGGVYDGESGKHSEFARTLPPFLLSEVLNPKLRSGDRAVILAEEWHTADAVLHLHWLLCSLGLRDRVSILWNANNTFGFDCISWDRLREAAVITTVSRYMRHCMGGIGVDPMVIPNGLSTDAFDPPDRSVVAQLRGRFRDRTLLTKMARWDPDKRWLSTISIVAEMKRQGWRPLLIARGGSELHGEEVLRSARYQGLRVVDRGWREEGAEGFLRSLWEVGDADVVNLVSHVDSKARRALFRASNAVLANSSHEPFGLVGLEAMAAGGIACTGCSGEEYAIAGHNALVLQTAEPREFMGLYRRLCADSHKSHSLRRAGQSTARRYAWPEVLARVLLPRVDLEREIRLPGDVLALLPRSAPARDRLQQGGYAGLPRTLIEEDLHPPYPLPVKVRRDSRRAQAIGLTDQDILRRSTAESRS